MFALFLAGTCFSFVMGFVVLASVYSRWGTLLIMLLTLLNGILVVGASVIATVMFIIMRNVLESNTTVNIGANVGVAMFALMWTASACAIFAFIIQLSLSCCCASRRDVRTGRKRGSEKAYQVNDVKEDLPPAYEKRQKRRWFTNRGKPTKTVMNTVWYTV